MAKVTSPLMSLDASGSVAGALTFSKWKGRNYVRQLVIPANPRSAAQQETRAALGAGGRMGSFVGEGGTAQLALNAAAPSGQSGVGYLVKLITQRYATADAAYNNASNSTEKGYFDTAAATLGIQPITIPGDVPVVVPAGLILWVGYEAAHFVSATIAPTAAVDATAGNITTFTTALAAA